MAAEAAKSPGCSPDSYIGSLISLTSKCEIRYEGILYNINTQESSIGLRNVQSFGTEGRKKDSPQIPANAKYMNIYYFGELISSFKMKRALINIMLYSIKKDLQVKAPPPVQSPSIHNEPAIIQSHYSHPASTSTSLPSVGNGAIPDLNSNTPHLGLQRPTFQSGLPLYQPGGNIGSWGPTSAPPIYWPGHYAPSGALTHLQQSPFLRPPPGLPIAQYPAGNTPSLPELPPDLFQAAITQSLSSSILPSTVAPTQTSLLASEKTTSPMPNIISPTTTQNIPSIVSGKPTEIPAPTLDYQTVSQATPSVIGSSSSNIVDPVVLLVASEQLLPVGPSTTPLSSQPLEMSNKDVEVKPQEAKKKPSLSESPVDVPAKMNESILPLPKPTHQKPNGADMQTHHYNRGCGRGRGRANGYTRPATKFTEDFDFMAMNEKFNKDEVWGHLGKSMSPSHDREGDEDDNNADDNLEGDEAEMHKPDIKPVYVKDDFFDTLSSNTLDRESRGRRTKYSEQKKINTETFGNLARHRPNRGGGRGFRGEARSYYGRGRGFGARG